MKIRYLLLASLIVWATLAEPVFGDSKQGNGDLLEIKAINGTLHVDIFAENTSCGDITVILDVGLSNLWSPESLPLTVTVLPNSKVKLVRLLSSSSNEKYEYRYEYKTAYGSLASVHNDDYKYRLPYDQNSRYPVIQSFGGGWSHSESSFYAVDFAMPTGSQVYAAREGLVVAIKNDSSIGGSDESLKENGNFVYIRHPDRTLGVYAHFKKQGVLVNSGDNVVRGQLIGLSGDTGWSTGPHLHFSVHKLLGGGIGESCRFVFETGEGIVETPIVGGVYSVK